MLKLVVLLMSFTFSSNLMAQTLLFEMTYPADEQASGCAVRHVLYDDSAEQVSMLWVAESICAGEVTLREQVTFSQNTMKAWPVLLRKAAVWGHIASLEREYALHHWGDDIAVKIVRSTDILGEQHVHFSMQDLAFPEELQRPILVDVSNNTWKTLADAIAQQAYTTYAQ